MNLLGSYNMKKLKFKTFVFALLLTVSFSAKAIPTPEAVEPQYDDDGNPMYYVAYGKGDRIDPATEKPLNLIQIYCQDKAVDFVSEEELEKCRADESLVEMKYGWMDFATYKGERADQDGGGNWLYDKSVRQTYQHERMCSHTSSTA